MTEIKHKITNLLNSVNEGQIAYDELELTLKYVINNDVSKDEAFSFLDLLHFSPVSKIISQNNSHFWAMKTAEIIEKYNYHTGQLLLQRLNRYKNKTANQNASKANFNDVTDFIGWYTTQSENMVGISKKDYYNQYLAYHEGQNGWSKETFKSKEWLIEVAKTVERNTNMFNKQLKSCEDKLNRKGLFGIF